MEFFSSNIKKFLIFSQKKTSLVFSPMKDFLILRETETLKNICIFSQKKTVFIFQEKETPKNS